MVDVNIILLLVDILFPCSKKPSECLFNVLPELQNLIVNTPNLRQQEC